MNKIRSGIAAGIFFSESSIRYAVVNHEDGSTLERLGSCDFDYDLLSEFRSGLSQSVEKTLGAALADVLVDVSPSSFTVGVHPHLSRTYYTLTPSDADTEAEAKQFLSEGRLLFGNDTDFHPTVSALHHVVEEGSDVRRDWKMVTLIPTDIKNPIDRLVATVATEQPQYMSPIQAGQRVVYGAETASGNRSSFALMVGQYAGNVDMALLHNGNIVHGHTVSPETPEDYLYWVVVLATRIDISLTDINRVYYYGDQTQAEMFDDVEHATHAEIVRVDPFRFTGVNVGHLRADFDPTSYTSCLGMVV